MTTRVWVETDPEPGRDITAIVDSRGVVWARCTCNVDFPDDPPSRYWHEHLLTHRGGVVLGGSIENTWADVWGSLPSGSTLREASSEERDDWQEVWA